MTTQSAPALTWEQVSTWALGAPLLVAMTVIVAVLLRWFVHRVITRVVRAAVERHEDRLRRSPSRTERAFASVTELAPGRQIQRIETLASVLKSVGTVTIVTLTLLTVMAIVGIPLGPVLASAGVGGVALGFGAQSLVKDFLSGIFMIVEDQYGVGDYIDTGEAVGYVEDVSLRVTRLRDRAGRIWYVRNGEILRIGNHSQGWSLALVDIPIAYDENVGRATDVIRQVLASFATEPVWVEHLVAAPKVAGVESVLAGAMTIRVEAQCVPDEHTAVARELRERIKVALDGAGVRGPLVSPGQVSPPPPG